MTPWPWPIAIDDGGSRHLTKGRGLPSVVLPATSGSAVDFAALPGRTVVFCYPWTGAPGVANPPDWDTIPGAHGSTPEAEGFRNLYSAFATQQIAVFGLSTQTTAYQRALVGRLNLPYAIVSDHEFAWTNALRLPTFATGGMVYLRRITLIVTGGKIERVYYPVAQPDTHPREVLAWCTATAGYADESRLKGR